MYCAKSKDVATTSSSRRDPPRGPFHLGPSFEHTDSLEGDVMLHSWGLWRGKTHYICPAPTGDDNDERRWLMKRGADLARAKQQYRNVRPYVHSAYFPGPMFGSRQTKRGCPVRHAGRRTLAPSPRSSAIAVRKSLIALGLWTLLYQPFESKSCSLLV